VLEVLVLKVLMPLKRASVPAVGCRPVRGSDGLSVGKRTICPLGPSYDANGPRARFTGGRTMSLLSKIFGGKSSEPAKRVRVCVECGMPVENHKDWCSILRARLALQAKRAEATSN